MVDWDDLGIKYRCRRIPRRQSKVRSADGLPGRVSAIPSEAWAVLLGIIPRRKRKGRGVNGLPRGVSTICYKARAVLLAKRNVLEARGTCARG